MARDSELKAVLSLLDELGATVDDIGGGKHHKVRWRKGDFKAITIVPRTASDHRSKKNTLAIIKRQIRSIKDGRLRQGRTGSNVPGE
jgi:hypothetical protein